MVALQKRFQMFKRKRNIKKILGCFKQTDLYNKIYFYGCENDFVVSAISCYCKLEVKREGTSFLVRVHYTYKDLNDSYLHKYTKIELIEENDWIYKPINELYLLNIDFLKKMRVINDSIRAVVKKGGNMEDLQNRKEWLEECKISSKKQDHYERNVLGKTPTFPFDPAEYDDEISKISVILDERNGLYSQKYALEKKCAEDIKVIIKNTIKTFKNRKIKRKVIVNIKKNH